MAGARASLEGRLGLRSDHRYFTHEYGGRSGRNGSLVEEEFDSGRKSKCPGGGRGSMDQGKKPHPLCPAEGERVYPSCRLGERHTRTEEAGRVLQEPDWSASPCS